MKRIVQSTLFILALFSTIWWTAIAQGPPVAKPDENARIKPLVTAETQAREALNAKIATLPEAKAYKDAEDALKRAAEALNKAAGQLPEDQAWKQAQARVLDEAYRIQAAHGLSSREYRPELNDKGELVFARATPPKQ